MTHNIVQIIDEDVKKSGGWISFDRFMELALYAPNYGYYTKNSAKIGSGLGTDFTTSPEISPYFARALWLNIEAALAPLTNKTIYEIGAGTGRLADQLIQCAGAKIDHYVIVERSAYLRQQQQETLHSLPIEWLEELPREYSGVLIGNEILDAMPVKLLVKKNQGWYERGVVASNLPNLGFQWQEVPWQGSSITELDLPEGYVTEWHLAVHEWIKKVAKGLINGSILLIDYGFPHHEYYHPQRIGGTLMCHQTHLADTNPLVDIGDKDITSHIDFSRLAQYALDQGLDLLGYTSQGHFLINSGILHMLNSATLQEKNSAYKLFLEHEMGELFKVIAFSRDPSQSLLGFSHGDRSHTL
ncbi:MAG: SAM-dependent methyltransferase [Gammaproteobacteria bacterium]|nr:SAM-dependent methyltransferase [Gammaproteobacteria bacterium]